MKAQNPALDDYIPSSYTINPEHANIASSSTNNHPRSGSRYRDEDLPAYEETPLIPKVPSGRPRSAKPQPEIRRRLCQPPPEIPSSCHDSTYSHVQTCFPEYSNDAETLRQMIYEQAAYPPIYYVELKGTHTETTYRRGDGVSFIPHNPGHRHRHRHHSSSWSTNGIKQSQKTITDFFIRINITYLLSSGPGIGGELKLLADDETGYRGGIIKRFTPSIGSPDLANQHEELKAWCDKYVSEPSSIKSFALERVISNHDTKKLESLLRSLIASTNYRGNVSVHFPITHESVTVYSPSWVNKWRMATWVRWLFYLTFLWIFSWPFLFLSTARYEVAKVVYPYADLSPEEETRGVERRPTVMSEEAWVHLWENAIRRGVLGRMDCTHFEMGDEYRLATQAMMDRGETPFVARKPSRLAGFFGVGIQFPARWQEREGWGYDS